MSWLVSAALRQRLIVVLVASVLLALGIDSARKAPIDVFPEFAPPLVEIQTEAPGLSTEEVESLVSMPLEFALAATPYLKIIRSKSVLGLSSVVMIFEDGTDLYKARQAVQERLPAARLPAVVRPPVMMPPLSAVSRVHKIGLSSATLDRMDLTLLVRWTIRPRLLGVPGVANVAVWGERDPQLQIRVDPDRLRAHGVTLAQVQAAAGQSVAVEAGGFVDTPTQRFGVRHVSPATTPAGLADAVVVIRGDTVVRLSHVAEIVRAPAPPIGDAVINGRKGLLLIVEKYPWANTLDVTSGVDAALAALAPALRDVDIDPYVFRPATFVLESVSNLGRALLWGSLLVVLILFAFLAQWRAAVISLTAIPLSLAIAAWLLVTLGATVNTMMLAGLAIAVGEVVDDAIIDVENVLRRLRLSTGEEPTFLVVLKASLEVRSSVVYATLIVVLVFLPVFFLGGLAGAFFRPLALAYIAAVLASLLVALTVTPALCLSLLPGKGLTRREPALTRWLREGYGHLLRRLLAYPKTIALGLLLTFAATGFAATRLGAEFLPEFRERDFLMHWIGKPGTSLQAMQRITLQVSRELGAIPGVRSFGSHLGRAEAADEVVGPNFAELWISVSPEADYDATLAKVRSVVDGYPGLFHDVLTYLKERIKEVLTGASGALVVRIFGGDLARLREEAARVGTELGGIAGVADLKVEPQTLVPQIQIRLRPYDAARIGLTGAQVRSAAATLMRGTKVGEVYAGDRVTDVVVWGTPAVRRDLAAVRALRIDTPGGYQVPLREVADVEIVPAPNEVKRERASRRIDVTCNVKGRDLAAVARDVEAAVRALPFARGHHAEVLGEDAARRDSSQRLLLFGLLSVLGILLVLYLDFRCWRAVVLLGGSLPFALIGGVWSALLAGGTLSLGSLIGFVTVLGIGARNGILLVSHYRELAAEAGGGRLSVDVLVRGAQERLAPILMTALCTGLALAPIAAGGDIPGHEIEHPMAIVIVGGLATSTLLSLVVLPILCAPLLGASRRS